MEGTEAMEFLISAFEVLVWLRNLERLFNVLASFLIWK